MSTVEIESAKSVVTDVSQPDLRVITQRKKQKTWFGRKRSFLVLVSAAFVLLLVFVAIFADIIAPYRPEFIPRGKGVAWQEPSAAHWLGTDGLGRDLLSRLMHGARVTIVLAVGVAAFQLSVGILLGMLSGFFGGWIDFIIMRIADLLYAFPGLLLIILVVSVVDSSIPRVITAFVVISLVTWPDICRLTRAQILSLKQREFVQASEVMGATPMHIMLKHLFPNFIRPIASLVPLGMGLVVLSEASLSFLGLGIVPPGASWGNMISDVAARYKTTPLILLAPSLSLVFTVMALSYLSDWLLDE
jgi:ABC-type dipeptide/oligopeptide/nickel transport system permease subunit